MKTAIALCLLACVLGVSLVDSGSFPSTASLGMVRVHLRRIGFFFGSPNHWATVVEAIGYGFINVQLDSSEMIQVSYHSTASEAARKTWGFDYCDIRTSEYGNASQGLTVGDLRYFVAELHKGRFARYSLGDNDGQNFARALVKLLNGKWVGVFPIEDGPDYDY